MSVKFNPIGPPFDFTGKGGGSSPENFSYDNVVSGKTLTIPINQQMLFKGIFRVEGFVIIRGTILSVKDDSQQMGHWNPIPAEAVVFIPNNRVMFYKFILRIIGTLRNHGTVEAS